MGYIDNRKISKAVLVVLCLLISSCVLFNNEKKIAYPESDQEFVKAIDWYGSIVEDEQAAMKDKSKAHLRLGMIYSHYRNPSLDYDLALRHVDKSISMLNGAVADDNVMNLRSLLNSIIGIDISSLPVLRELNDNNRALARENAELRKTLKELNELEVELERKRREIK